MSRYDFSNVPVVRSPRGRPSSAFDRLWKLLMKSTEKGKRVHYEETRREDGKVVCGGFIED